MDEELKENEDLESIFQEIRDIVGTKNLDEIVDFIMNRNKASSVGVEPTIVTHDRTDRYTTWMLQV